MRSMVEGAGDDANSPLRLAMLATSPATQGRITLPALPCDARSE
jgi:hypothetical protein